MKKEVVFALGICLCSFLLSCDELNTPTEQSEKKNVTNTYTCDNEDLKKMVIEQINSSHVKSIADSIIESIVYKNRVYLGTEGTYFVIDEQSIRLLKPYGIDTGILKLDIDNRFNTDSNRILYSSFSFRCSYLNDENFKNKYSKLFDISNDIFYKYYKWSFYRITTTNNTPDFLECKAFIDDSYNSSIYYSYSVYKKDNGQLILKCEQLNP